MHDNFPKIANRIETYREWAIDIEKQLTAAPAISPESGGHGELKKAQIVEKLLQEIGVEQVERIDAPDERADGGVRPNIIARIDGDRAIPLSTRSYRQRCGWEK